MQLLTLLALLPLPLALAAPSSSSLVARQQNSNAAPTLLSSSQVSAFQDPAHWAEASYCNPQVGNTVNTAQVLYAAGDGTDVPRVYVAYSSSKNTIVVSHQGTNTSSLSSIENDIDVLADSPDPRLAGCVPAGSKIHSGFQDTWAQTADGVLAAVMSAQATHPSAAVLVTGHSLGAAISAIDGAYLKCKGVSGVTTTLFGQPRTGNYAFASSLTLTHLGNYADPVIHLPPNSDSYWHSAGEVWQNPHNSLQLYNCPGYENTNCAWSIQFYEYDVNDHTGTYAGVPIPGRDSTACAALGLGSNAVVQAAPLSAFRPRT